MNEQEFKREVRQALEAHQPKDGPRGICSCNSTYGGGSDAFADHQAYEVIRRLRNRGHLRELLS